MLLQAKWFLGGSDVLLGRKTIRQRLINIAESEGLSTRALFWKPWGWYKSGFHQAMSGDKKKFEALAAKDKARYEKEKAEVCFLRISLSFLYSFNLICLNLTSILID